MSVASDASGDRARRERAEQLFEEARSLPPSAWISHIDQACGDDGALRAELQSLLEHADAAERFFGLLGQLVITEDLTGTVVAGRYEIGACVGMGGMGAVYRARDNRLQRDVALKFLARHPVLGPGNEHHLLREARAAAALEHTNICTVYEVGATEEGQHFISMAFYEGETLKDRLLGGSLPVAEAVRVARQIACGLGSAHARGIIHRDVKPGNVMLARDGTVKLLDFGLARSSDASLTAPAATPGTVAYMSPEQVRGDGVDERSDLFSVGVVLYEMLAGANPFRRATAHALMQAILHEEPQPLDERRPAVPAALLRIVTRLLRKGPADRYANAVELVADLDRVALKSAGHGISFVHQLSRRRRLVLAAAIMVVMAAAITLIQADHGGGTAPPPASALNSSGSKAIAVLPFINVNRDPEQDYLVDGLTEELIGALSRVRSLRVVARTSAFTYRGAVRDIREIGNSLNAGTIVEGSVQKVGDSIRVRAQLINAADGLHLWSETYDRKLTDILALQRDLALRIAAELEIELSTSERQRVGRQPTMSPDAWTHYVKGRHYWNQRTPAAFSRAIEHFQRAIDLDPRFAAAHAGLATAYSVQGIWSQLGPAEARGRVQAAALRAVELDDQSAEAHSVLGVSHHAYGWDTDAAEREQLRAIELDPEYALARFFYGNLLRANGRVDEALAQYRVAAALDPLDANTTEALGSALLLVGEQLGAFEVLSNALQLDSMYWRSNAAMAEYHEITGDRREALRLYEKALYLGGSSYALRSGHARVLALLGREAEARHMLDELRADASRAGLHDPFVATLFLALNDPDGALAWLEQSYRERHPLLRFIGGSPRFKSFEADPRYVDLLRRIGLRT